MKKGYKKVWVIWMHEHLQFDDNVRYEFDSLEEARNFMKAMQGVLFMSDSYSEIVKAKN